MNHTRKIYRIMLLCSILTLALPLAGGEAANQRQTVSLNGIWDFYPNGGSDRHDIRVPSWWDAPQDFGYPMEWLHMLHGVYKKEVFVPNEMQGKQIFLEFDRISVIAKLFVNGKQVGGDESNGYLMMLLPYKIDITDIVIPGKNNQIEMQIWGGQQETFGEGVETEWKEADFPADALDGGKMLYPWCVDHYDGRRGIGGDVKLTASSKVYIENVFVIPDLGKNGDPADDTVSLEVTVVNKSESKKTLTISNKIEGCSDVPEIEIKTLTLKARSQKTVTWSDIEWPGARYWWPHDPYIYTLATTLKAEQNSFDKERTRFGMRQFYVNGNTFELNGIRTNLRCESYEFSWHEGALHGSWLAPVLSTKELTVDVQERLMKAYQELNLNTLRVHKASGINATFEIADTLGMLVIDEVPFWQTQQRTDERAAPYFQAWVRQWVKARRNHPSIVLWSICNECWGSPIAEATYKAAVETDPTRPAYHQGIRKGNFDGDFESVHYTGGYPYKAFNTDKIYDLYKNNPDKPKSEGESMFAEGWPLLTEDGKLSGEKAARGEWDHPDILSQAEWVRGTARFIRAMRYADYADVRSYLNWIYCFEVIEDDIYPKWTDLTAPEIKPTVLHRPVCNTFDCRYPEIIKGDGHEYWADSHAPVAVFDKAFDAENRIGAEPNLYRSGDIMNRELVVYNDTHSDGESVEVQWQLSVTDPHMPCKDAVLLSGSAITNVPYGEKQLQPLSFQIPESSQSGWLNLTLKGYKNGRKCFDEVNRLGALSQIPEAKIAVSNTCFDLGKIEADSTQWKKIKLINLGGGASLKWKVDGTDEEISMNLTSGNLRKEQEVYFRIHPVSLESAKPVTKTLVFSTEEGGSVSVNVRYTLSCNRKDCTK